MFRRNRWIGLALVAGILLLAAPAVWAAFTPEVFAVDQPLVDNVVVVTRATSDGPGWLVVHADKDGAPGPVLGYTALPAGISANVKVEIDVAAATDILHAMLHTDAGQVGAYEFPDGPDVPVKRGNSIVMAPFQLTSRESSLVQVIQDTPELSTLATAIDAAGLGAALRDVKVATVFAPTDDAFAAIPKEGTGRAVGQPRRTLTAPPLPRHS